MDHSVGKWNVQIDLNEYGFNPNYFDFEASNNSFNFSSS